MGWDDKATYKGLRKETLERILASLRIDRIVDAKYLPRERFSGSYNAAQHVLSDFGAQVVKRIHEEWEREYGESL